MNSRLEAVVVLVCLEIRLFTLDELVAENTTISS